MREVLDELLGLVARRRDRRRRHRGRAPGARRPGPPGASMLVGPDGEAVGSVSGGCVEGAVYELARRCATSGRPVLQRYGVSDDDAFAVGLTCGGILDVFVEQVDARDASRSSARSPADIEAGRPVAVVHGHRAPRPRARRAGGWSCGRTTRPSRSLGTLGSGAPTTPSRDDARGLLASGRTETLHLRPGRRAARRGHARCSWPRTRPSRGCSCSARSTSPRRWPGSAASSATGSRSATRGRSSPPRTRFPEADEVVVEWPHRYLAAEADAGRSTSAP